MKVVKMFDGLGNQLFQYAMLVALREHYHEQVWMDISWFETGHAHNGFELSQIFNITAPTATKEDVLRLRPIPGHKKLSRYLISLFPNLEWHYQEAKIVDYYPEVFEMKRVALFQGWWQHYEYFEQCRDILLQEFTLKQPLDERNQALYEEMNANPKAVSVHVRRGDYLKASYISFLGVCPPEYYRDAVDRAQQLVGEDADFYVFSDDMAWCKETLPRYISPDKIRFVDWNRGPDSYKDTILMTACRTNIIANSTFSWWSAYLNRHADAITLAPEKWWRNGCSKPIQMSRWELIPFEFESVESCLEAKSGGR